MDLSYNGIGDDGAGQLAGSLAMNSVLVRLDLTGNEISEDGACQFESVLMLNTTLRELILQDTTVPLKLLYSLDAHFAGL